LTLTFLFFLFAMGAAQTPAVVAAPAQPAFQDFATRVDNYMKVRKSVQSWLPHEKPTKKRKQIQERQAALARAIREARPSAKQGDIFTDEISRQFRAVINDVFQGPNARYVRKTIREGAPVKGWTLSVNAAYPEHLPLTTVPPTLLLRLPEVPNPLAYHIIGRDLVLQDSEARMVIDFIPAALPLKAVP
jgi:hypothetical protein